MAGVAAAELVVDGAGLQQVIGSAAAALNGWQIGLPQDPVERNEYRTRALVGIVLYALEQVTRDPEPAGRAGQLRRAARAEPRPGIQRRDHLLDGVGRQPRSVSLTADLQGDPGRGGGVAGRPVAALSPAHRPARGGGRAAVRVRHAVRPGDHQPGLTHRGEVHAATGSRRARSPPRLSDLTGMMETQHQPVGGMQWARST